MSKRQETKVVALDRGENPVNIQRSKGEVFLYRWPKGVRSRKLPNWVKPLEAKQSVDVEGAADARHSEERSL